MLRFVSSRTTAVLCVLLAGLANAQAQNPATGFKVTDVAFGAVGEAIDGWSPAEPRMLVDLNRDGIPDIIGFGAEGVYVALGSGRGTFEPSSLVLRQFGARAGGWSTTRHPRMVLDLNNDGIPDIIGFGNARVVVALGKGDGTFDEIKTASNRFIANEGWSTEKHLRLVLDLNNDKIPDIIGFGNGRVVVALGKGDGTFGEIKTASNQFVSESGGWSIGRHPRMVLDLNKDGIPDIIGFGNSRVVVALGKGDGTFGEVKTASNQFVIDGGGWSVQKHLRMVLDLNKDGIPDIIGFGNGRVVVALGKGDGTFGEIKTASNQYVIDNGGWSTQNHPRMLVDLNKDGIPDIVGFANEGVHVANGKGDGTFQQAHPASPEFGALVIKPSSANHLRMVNDLNGDGIPDVIGFSDVAVYTALGKGGGKFANAKLASREFVSGNGGWSADKHPRLVLDLNKDGIPDIIGFGNGRVVVALGKGDGTFGEIKTASDQFTVNDGWAVNRHVRLVLDVNKDDIPDIIGFGNGRVVFARGKGDGTFAEAITASSEFTSGSGWSADKHPRMVLDLNKDGIPDIIGFGNAGVYAALGKGDGTFATAKHSSSQFVAKDGWTVANHPRVVLDLNKDGVPDIVGFFDDGIHVALGKGDGTFAVSQRVLREFGTAAGWSADKHVRTVLDVNRDGIPDIVGFGHDGVYVSFGKGNGTFANSTVVLRDLGVIDGWSATRSSRLLHDINGDGFLDVVGFGLDGSSIAIGGAPLPASQGVPATMLHKVLACYTAGTTTFQSMRDCAGVWVTPRTLALCAVGARCQALPDTVEGRKTFEANLAELAQGVSQINLNSLLVIQPADLRLPAGLALGDCVKQPLKSTEELASCLVSASPDQSTKELRACLAANDADKAICMTSLAKAPQLTNLVKCLNSKPVSLATVVACSNVPDVAKQTDRFEKCAAQPGMSLLACATSEIPPADSALAKCLVGHPKVWDVLDCTGNLGNESKKAAKALSCHAAGNASALECLKDVVPTKEWEAARCLTQQTDPSARVACLGAFGGQAGRYSQCLAEGDRADLAFCMLGDQKEVRALRNAYKCASSGEVNVANFIANCTGDFVDASTRQHLACIAESDGKREALLVCAAAGGLPKDVAYLASCATSSQGMTEFALCAVGPKISEEWRIAAECAVQSGGEPTSFATCTAGRLTVRELTKCLSGTFGKDCFGPNNEITKAFRTAFDDLTKGPGHNNDIVRTVNNATTEARNAIEQVLGRPGEALKDLVCSLLNC